MRLHKSVELLVGDLDKGESVEEELGKLFKRVACTLRLLDKLEDRRVELFVIARRLDGLREATAEVGVLGLKLVEGRDDATSDVEEEVLRHVLVLGEDLSVSFVVSFHIRKNVCYT